MRAAVCHAHGGPEALVFGELPDVSPGPGEVRVRVKACGLNFADSLLLSGNYQTKPPLPFAPGLEVAGLVDALGEGVSGFSVGQRVLAIPGWGGMAEFVAVPARDVFAIPDSLDFVSAAGFPVAYGTSHLGLTGPAALKPGEVLLVHGAAGGVGMTAVEIGKQLGATVIATAGGPDKVRVAIEAGADYGIDYKAEDVRERVKALTDGRGADVVYDPVGGDIFDASLRAVAPGARILIVGFASGKVPQIPANILLVKNVAVLGYYWGAYRHFAPQVFCDSMKQAIDWFAAGRLKPHVCETFPLERAQEAVAALLSRRTTGKVVVTVDPTEARA